MDVLSKKYFLDTVVPTRYKNIPIYYNDLFQNYVYGTFQNLSRSTSYTLYTVQRGDTWDNIALKFYGNPTYYWILCNFNRVTDPFMELKEGVQIAIPSMSNLEYLTY